MFSRVNPGQWLALVAAALICAPSAAAPSGEPLAAALRGLADQDARVARIGYQLTSANLALCPAPAKSAGFAVQALDPHA